MSDDSVMDWRAECFRLQGEIVELKAFLANAELFSPDWHQRLVWMTGAGQVIMSVHDASECAGRACTVHNPSDHRMRRWPTLYRDDCGLTERLCVHGVGHPDPDGAVVDRVHACDGCCHAG